MKPLPSRFLVRDDRPDVWIERVVEPPRVRPIWLVVHVQSEHTALPGGFMFSGSRRVETFNRLRDARACARRWIEAS